MVDLKQLAGAKYRITLDESAELDGSHAERLWFYRIPGKRSGKHSSFISVHGENTLAAWTDRSRAFRERLKAIPGVKVHQEGDHEVRVIFPVECLDAVATFIGAKRRRHLTDEQKAKLVAASSEFRFKPRG